MHKVVIITAAMIVVAAIALTFQFSTTDIEFSRFNIGWNGTSEFFNQLDAHGAEGVVLPADLSKRNDTLLLIIAPNTSFSSEEILSLKEFLEKGNTLFVADETGAANSLLEGLGSSIRIFPGNISSIDVEFTHFKAVIGYSKNEDLLLSNVSSLTFNDPSSLSGGDPLITTSILSWDDQNGNYRPDKDEPFSSFGILSRDAIGNGTLYILSDPSIFINGMMDAPMKTDNDKFIGNLLSLRKKILVEQSHSMTADMDKVLAVGMWAKTTMIIKISGLILCILLAGVAFYRRWI
jgi:hypothetical protein